MATREIINLKKLNHKKQLTLLLKKIYYLRDYECLSKLYLIKNDYYENDS